MGGIVRVELEQHLMQLVAQARRLAHEPLSFGDKEVQHGRLIVRGAPQ